MLIQVRDDGQSDNSEHRDTKCRCVQKLVRRQHFQGLVTDLDSWWGGEWSIGVVVKTPEFPASLRMHR